MRFLFILGLLLLTRLVWADNSTTPEPAKDSAPEIYQDHFLPSPFFPEDIDWNPTAGETLFIDENTLSLTISGNATGSELYLEKEKLNLADGAFAHSLNLTNEPGSFLFTVENKVGERKTYRVRYLWIQPPNFRSGVFIRDGDKVLQGKLQRTEKQLPASDWLAFSWQPEDSPLVPLTFIQNLCKRGEFLSVNVSGVLSLQSGGGNLATGKLAYSPSIDYDKWGAGLEFGISLTKNKAGSVRSQMSYQLFGRYSLGNDYLAELGLGLVSLGVFSGQTVSIVTARASKTMHLLPWMQNVFVAYSMLFFDTKLNQLEFGATFRF